jgi:Family of unknown function (DUF6922)
VVPPGVRPLFWEIDLSTFTPEAYPRYTIGRVLELGDERAYAWLKETFSDAEIKEVILHERRLSRRSANFWSLVYGLPRDQVAGLAEA